MTLTNEELEILRKYDSPTVSNVIELFGVRLQTEGYMDKTIKARFPELPPMVGYASTATFRCKTPKGTDSYGSLSKQVEAFKELPGPPIVVFEDLDTPLVGATFGELMCSSYNAFGAQGLITSGGGRDLDQVRALDFPVFTSEIIVSHGYSQIPSIHVPVKVGGLTINPGDLLHGDANGIVLIPDSIAKEVVYGCEPFIEAELVILDYLKGDNITPEGLSEAQAECVRLQKLIPEK
ncbi:MAG: RraA family protein [Cyclobacteriaceae bacterium]